MDFDAAREFLKEHKRAILSTYRKDGSAQMSPVLVVVDDTGRIVVSTRETSYKVRNLRRDPRASVCAIQDGFFGPWIQVDGTTEVLSLPGAMEPLVDYYRRAAGEHEDWDDYRRAMERERRCLLRITPERAGPDRQG